MNTRRGDDRRGDDRRGENHRGAERDHVPEAFRARDPAGRGEGSQIQSSQRDPNQRDPTQRDSATREPSGRPVPEVSRKKELNEYFINGEGINREVLQMEICKYLGANATCRPGDYNGQAGFKIRALRPFTPEMIYDLKTASTEYVTENRQRRAQRYPELSYVDSEARRRQDIVTGQPEDPHHPPPATYPSGGSYMEGNPVPNYPPSTMYSSGPGFPAGTAYAAAPATGGGPGYYMQTEPPRGYPGNYTYEKPTGREFQTQPGFPGGYPPTGYGEQSRPREINLPQSEFGYRAATGPEGSGRGAPIDERSRHYYEPTMAPQPGNVPGYGAPQRGQPSPYETGPPPRDMYGGRQGPPPEDVYNTNYRPTRR